MSFLAVAVPVTRDLIVLILLPLMTLATEMPDIQDADGGD
ncbi:hypothetical protein CTA1_3825 [Colletotrichum tanaceti]|uniref:Uncharacterized protein n=1 Tax=Colletotrichum tanaceti TaxID=1306861 RepID=A0A4U6X683_9PEZI|nr:hypothetical protein CTA1_3825 [Colletotrichum tanaceti]